ncbi:cytochrome P450 4C1-like [Topomyia yanbarensis]|uniref:cytochrome P450 4C1-like n=1 Tax=Topomyia yanbarensis TaxID=2498891 RepID=UPI00273C5CBB|nr:cytochrome P450 4C1-like [Topomyia yanbarensis]
MLAVLLTLITVVVLTYYYYFRRSRKRFYELAAKLPGPFDLPLIGSIHVGFRRGPTEIFDYLLQYLHTVPTPMRAWLGPFLFIFIDQPEHLAVVMNSQDCLKRSYVYQFFRNEKGLFNAPPELWRKLRKQLTPSFAVTSLRSFVPTFNKKADLLVKNMECLVGQDSFDMFNKVGEYALGTSAINSLGLDLDNDTSDFKKRYLENAEKMFTLMWSRIYKAWLQPEFIYKLTSSYREEMERLDMFRGLSKKVLSMRKEARQKDLKSVRPERDENNARRPQLFIDKLEQIANETGILDEEGVIQNLDTFIFASNDTTSSAVATTVLMLAMHPDVQERLYREIMNVVPGSYIDYDDVSKLDYLEMVIKEAMRLVPAGAAIGRVCEKEIQVGEYIIPANAQIVFPIFKLHRDKRIWGERSEEFDPENFSPENCAKRHPYAYQSFSGGIRNCIGIKYAYITMKIVLAKLIKSYTFSTDLTLADLKFHLSIVMRIANGYMVKLERRESKASHT